jgi:hypothetical protein
MMVHSSQRRQNYKDAAPTAMIFCGSRRRPPRPHFEIKTTFRQQIINAMKTLSPNYSDWQVPVTYRALPVGKNSKPVIDPDSSKPVS